MLRLFLNLVVKTKEASDTRAATTDREVQASRQRRRIERATYDPSKASYRKPTSALRGGWL